MMIGAVLMFMVIGAMAVVVERVFIAGHPELEERVRVWELSATPIIDRHAEQAQGEQERH
jgi:hypothetical protein